mmetsp:Transcript_19724/g.41632  ORF Transcript_19724/g.41632 Transcript_19724/m.41632 type:complete len:589 (-) Transcript_19724:922-2688(-)
MTTVVPLRLVVGLENAPLGPTHQALVLVLQGADHCRELLVALLGEGLRVHVLLAELLLRGLEGLLVHGELDRVRGRPGPQVVHSRLETLLPGVEVEGGHLPEVWIAHVDVEALALVDEGASVRRHVDEGPLLDLPHRLVDGLEVVGNGHPRHRAVCRDELILEVLVPEPKVDQVTQQVLVDHHELAAEDPPRVQVGGVGLEALVVAQDLAGRGRWHGRQQEAVPHAVLLDGLPEPLPVPPVARLDAPHVRLQHALADGAAAVLVVRGVDPVLLGRLHAGAQRSVVDRLEDVLVQLARLRAVEGQAEQDEGVSQALHADPDRAVPHVRPSRRLGGVEVDVDDLVQVDGHALGHPLQGLEVEAALAGLEAAHELGALVGVLGPLLDHEAGQRDRGQVAHGRLLRAGVLDDLRAQVGGLDAPKVLLVGLAVAGVLEEHVGVAGLDLGLQDREPEGLGLDCLPGLALALVTLVELDKLLTPAVSEPGALVGAEEAPVPVALDALHEEVGRPEAVEEVPGAGLLLAVVLAQVQPLKDVRVPGLQVNGKGALALAAALVHVARGVVEDAQHWHDAVRGAVGAADVARGAPNVVD